MLPGGVLPQTMKPRTMPERNNVGLSTLIDDATVNHAGVKT
jgi:hypothetical protein